MKRITTIFLITFTVISVSGAPKVNNSIGSQLFNNINIGWDIKRTSDYRWSDIHVGTAYGQTFDFDPKSSWQVGLNYNWNKYTLYPNGDLALSSKKSILRNRSITFPFIANYQVYKTFFTGVNFYTGPVCELILSSTLDRMPFDDYYALQLGWTVGTKVRFLAIFSAKLAYNFYPTPMFRDGTFNRSAVSFSLGF